MRIPMRAFDNLSRWLRSCAKPSRGQSLQALLDGYRSTALLYIFAKLKIADRLAQSPRSSEELSKAVGAEAAALHRFLRGCVVLGLCAEREDGAFGLTALGGKLRSDTPGPEYSLAILNGEEYAAAWGHLLQSVMTGETAFDHVFGESAWEHRQKHPELNRQFNAWLEKGAASAGQCLAQVYNFSPYRMVMDVGGGEGALLGAVLQANPSLKGILFDQSHVVAAARKKLESTGLNARYELTEGDFFTMVPSGADVFILKSILHDWDDEKCSVILRNCRAAMKSGQALLVLEKIMPVSVATRPATIMGDLHMLAVTGGKERTADEYRRLFGAAGFDLKKITPLPTGHNVLETARTP